MTTRNYEEKRALVSKWFTKEQLNELQGLENSPLVVKVHEHSSSNLTVPVFSALTEIADEKEQISEQINDFLRDRICADSLAVLLDAVYNHLNRFFEEGGEYPEELTVTKKNILDLINNTYDLVELIKLLIQLSESADRVKFFERRITLAKAGVSE